MTDTPADVLSQPWPPEAVELLKRKLAEGKIATRILPPETEAT